MSQDDEFEPGFPDLAKEWIDERVHKGGKTAYRSALQVFTSGFGKGLLTAAAITTVAIVGLALLSPITLGLAPTILAPAAIKSGLLIAGNTLLGSGLGLAILGVGGTVGSLISVHNENTVLNREAVEAEKLSYDLARTRGIDGAAKVVHVENAPECPGGHCAQLLQQRNQQQQEGLGR